MPDATIICNMPMGNSGGSTINNTGPKGNDNFGGNNNDNTKNYDWNNPANQHHHVKKNHKGLSGLIHDITIKAENAKQSHDEKRLSELQKLILLTLGAGIIPEFLLPITLQSLTAVTIPEIAGTELLLNPAMVDAAIKGGALTLSAKEINLFGIFSTKKNAFPFNPFNKLKIAHLSTDQIVDKVIKIGIDTKENEALLWSGFGKEGVSISEDFASKCGFKTLEMTKGGQWLQSLDLFNPHMMDPDKAMSIWREVSLEFAKRSKGNINIITGYVRENSIFMNEIEQIEDKSRLNYLLLQPSNKSR